MTTQTKIQDIMSKNLKTCLKETTLQGVARMMADADCGAIPVVDSKKNLTPIGIITDRDIVSRILAKGEDPFKKTVGDCMTKNCITVNQDSNLSNCLKVMEDKQVRRVVVVDDQGHCCGVVSQADIAKHSSEGRVAKFLKALSQPSKARKRAAA